MTITVEESQVTLMGRAGAVKNFSLVKYLKISRLIRLENRAFARIVSQNSKIIRNSSHRL
jgi:hypothetical protein